MDVGTAVITGGTGELARAVAPRMAARGFKLALTYLVPKQAETMEEALGLAEDRVLFRRVDCTDPAAVERFFGEAADELGPINVLASFVGGWAGGRDVAETDDVRFDRMIDVNLRSAFYAVRAAVPHLRQASWGRIILVGSRAAFETPPGQAAYNVAKAGVVALAKSVAQELIDTEVTANAILPSVIDTAATRAALPFADYVDWPKPAEIAPVIDFLATEGSRVINGAAIPVFGGA